MAQLYIIFYVGCKIDDTEVDDAKVDDTEVGANKYIKEGHLLNLL
jgi:hypothetical protein